MININVRYKPYVRVLENGEYCMEPDFVYGAFKINFQDSKIEKALLLLENVRVRHEEHGIVFVDRFGCRLNIGDISTSTKMVILALSGYSKQLPLAELGVLHMDYIIKENISCSLYGDRPIFCLQEVSDLDLVTNIQLCDVNIKTYGDYIHCLYKGDF